MLDLLRTTALLLTAVLACGCDPDPVSDAGPDGDIVFMPRDAAQPSDAGPLKTVGSACTEDSDCPAEAPVCLLEETFVQGYCTEFCLDGETDVCPSGSHCTAIRFMMSACLAGCDPSDSMCREGYGCGEAADDPVCAPGCDTDADCPEGLACNADDGQRGEGECFDPEASLGDPCVEPDACTEDGWCIRERDRGYPGGTCTIFRCDEETNTGCGDGMHCVFDFYADPICLPACDGPEDCRDGYTCAPDPTYPERVRCTPMCTSDADCLEPTLRCGDDGRCG
ncbi:MAG: hypothetical protein AB8I08_07210 [Sandaracinaceae bacterium]